MRSRHGGLPPPLVHSRLSPNPGGLSPLRGHSTKLAHPRNLRPYPRSWPHRPHASPPTRLSRLPCPELCYFRSRELHRDPVFATGDRPRHLSAHRSICAPALRGSCRHGCIMARSTLSLHGKLRSHAAHRNALHLLRSSRLVCFCLGDGSTAD